MEKLIYPYKLYGREQFKNPLPEEEQKKYLELAIQGDYNARQKIFEHNLRLVSNMVNKHYYNFEYNLEELFQVGSLALWEAIPKFKLEYNTKFSTYVVPIISGTIKTFLRKNTIIHFPNAAQDLAYKIKKIKEEHSLKNIELTPEQMAEILEESEENIKVVLAASQQVASLEEPLYSNQDGSIIRLGESIIDSNTSIEQQFEEKERNEIILQVIESLGEHESYIIRATFGIGCDKKTQREMAKILNVSRAQVSRLYKISLKRLRYILPNYLNGNLKCPKKLIKQNSIKH